MLIDILNTIRYAKEKGALKSKSKLDKGERLERDTFDTLYVNLKGYKKVLVDLLLPNGKGGTTQLDLVLLHETGIYVIECKNYKAKIEGMLDDDEWSVVYPKERYYSMYNPIKQNEGHVSKLLSVVGKYKKSYYKSLIVFGSESELKGCKYNKVIRGVKTRVLTEVDLVKCIEKIPDGKSVLSKKEIKGLYTLLSYYSRSSKRDKRKHNNYVKNVQSNRGC